MIFYIFICSMLSSKAFRYFPHLNSLSNSFRSGGRAGIKSAILSNVHQNIRSKTTILGSTKVPSPLSSPSASSSSNDKEYNEFEYLGLVPELVTGLTSQEISVPTPVQRAVIPRLLSGENLVMAASTGSGKTLAFFLPTAQIMHAQETQGYQRQVKRPRCLVLVPTRELARQVLSTVKSLSHYCKLSSTALMGGEDFSMQKRSLDKLIDVVVGSPERVIQHKEKGHLYMSQVTHVIIDEVDTMLTQGFGSHIRAILRSVMNRNNATHISSLNATDAVALTSEETSSKQPLQLIMATATLTKAVKTLLTDVDGAFNIEFNDPGNLTPRKRRDSDATVKMKIVEVDGVHRTLPHVKHDTQEVKGADKLVVLQEVMSRYDARKFRTMIFCNTIDSARAVDYALTEAGHVVQSYHGDLNSKERETGLDRFRSGERQYLVCTDIAARGIDIPEVDHVIMFDFPLNPIDYLHRAGRCGRAGRKGLVTALVAKRDQVLSKAIQGAITRGLPIDELTSEKKDYQDKGKLAAVMGRQTRQQASEKARREAARNKELGIVSKPGKVNSASSKGGVTDKPRSAMAARMNESLKERLISRRAAASVTDSSSEDSTGAGPSAPRRSAVSSRGRPSSGGPRDSGAPSRGGAGPRANSASRSRATRVPTSSSGSGSGTGTGAGDDRPRRPSSGRPSSGRPSRAPGSSSGPPRRAPKR